MSNAGWARSVATVILPLLALTSISSAVPLAPGDIVVDAESSGDVYRVDPSSGAASLISTDGLLFNPNHLIIDQQGRILTAERGRGMLGGAGIVRIDPSSGMQSMLAPATSSTIPIALGFDQSGNIIVGNEANQLIRVDPQSGADFNHNINGDIRNSRCRRRPAGQDCRPRSRRSNHSV